MKSISPTTNSALSFIPSFKSPFEKSQTNPIPLAKEDLLLCTTSLLAWGSCLLENAGYSSYLLRPVSYLTVTCALFGESLIGAKTFDDASSAAFGVALTGARLALFRHMHAYPALKPLAMLINAYGTYAVVSKAYQELNKCWQLHKKEEGKHNWLIARNVFVHSVNASHSTFMSISLLDFCRRSFFPYSDNESKSFPKKTYESTPRPPYVSNEDKKFITGINKLSANEGKLSEKDLACRTLYYDPSCPDMHKANSSCAPTCENVKEVDIHDAYETLVEKMESWDKQPKTQQALSSIGKAHEFFLNLFKEEKRQKELQALKEELQSLSNEASKIIGLKDQYPENLEFARKLLPSADRLLDEISSRDQSYPSTSGSAKSDTSDLDAFCKNSLSTMSLKKYTAIESPLKTTVNTAHNLIDNACQDIQAIVEADAKVKNVISFQSKNEPGKLACKIYKKACEFLQTQIPTHEEAAQELTLSKKAFKNISPSPFRKVLQFFGRSTSSAEFSTEISDRLKAVSEQKLDLTKKISFVEKQLVSLDEEAAKIGTASIHLDVSQSKNPYSPKLAAEASSILLQEQSILEKQFKNLKLALTSELEELKTLKSSFEPIYNRFQSLKTESIERLATSIIDLENRVSITTGPSIYQNTFFSSLSPKITPVLDTMRDGKAPSEEDIKALKTAFRDLNLQLHPDKGSSSENTKQAASIVNSAWDILDKIISNHNNLLKMSSQTSKKWACQVYKGLCSLLEEPLPAIPADVTEQQQASKKALSLANKESSWSKDKPLKKAALATLDALKESIQPIEDLIKETSARIGLLRSEKSKLDGSSILDSYNRYTPQEIKSKASNADAIQKDKFKDKINSLISTLAEKQESFESLKRKLWDLYFDIEALKSLK